ncbi:helix-turn-helix transcriptional regulator [Paracoccus onubensis]|nr:helix-turn-helix transcriptional regulator [Paracoccus onubensis]
MPRLPRRLHLARSTIRQPALRLLPLAGFAWGNRGRHPRPRTNPDHVLLWITAGELHLDFPRRQQILPHGSIQFVPAGTAFATFPGSSAQGSALLLAPPILPESEPSFPGQPLAGSVDGAKSQLSDLFAQIEAETSRPDPDIKTLHRILHLLARHLGRLEPVRKPSDRIIVPHGHAQESLAGHFMTAAAMQLQNGATVAEIAAELGTNTGFLDRACRDAYGKRAIEVMNELRLEQAMEMLRDSNLSATRIAQKLGYTSFAHFTRIFVSATGSSPETYRDQSR